MMYKTMPTMFLILLILISCGQGSMGLFFSLERVGAAEEESPPDSTITEESPPASTITEESPPAPTLTVGNTQLTVTWTEPLNDDGSAITEYHLRHREDGSDNWTVLNSGIGPHARSYTITELKNGAAYEVQVRAIGAQGAGAWSDSSTMLLPVTDPSAPAAPTLTAGNTQLTATWTDPLNDRGSAITEYHLQHREDGSDNWTVLNSGIGAHARSYTITELTNGAAYEVQVRAVNVLGAGSWSDSSTMLLPVTVPDAPAAPTLTAGNTQLTATWTEPLNDGGSPITEYRLICAYKTDASDKLLHRYKLIEDITGTSYTITELTNDVSYLILVLAVNELGHGEWSEISTATPTADP